MAAKDKTLLTAAEASKLQDGVRYERAKPSTLAPSPTNPRKTFPVKAHEELTASVKAMGVAVPLLVRPWPEEYPHTNPRPLYEIVAGERRYRAATAAELDTVPVIVRHLTNEQVLAIQVIENLQREDLNPMEEGEGFRRMVDDLHYSVADLVKTLGKPRTYIYNALMLVKVCPEVREALAKGEISKSVAHLLARIPVPALQSEALKGVTKNGEGVPFRQAEEFVRQQFMLSLAKALFPRADQTLVPNVPRCAECPKRTGNHKDAYPDIKNGDLCTDPICFKHKTLAHHDRLKAAAKEEGRVVLLQQEAKQFLPYGPTCSPKDGYIDLSDDCYDYPRPQDAKEWPTWRKLLGKEFKPEIMVLCGQGDKAEYVQLAKRETVTAFLAEQGLVSRRISESTAANQREQERKHRAENQWRLEVFKATHKRYHEVVQARPEPMPNETELRLVAEAFFRRLDHECQKRLVRYLWPQEEASVKFEPHEQISKFRKNLSNLSQAEIVVLLMDMTMVNDSSVSFYSNDKAEKLVALASVVGVDPKAIRKDLASAAQAKQKAKEKAAAAKEAKKAKGAAEAGPGWNVGDEVRIKEGLKGPNGIKRKCCGRTGKIETVTGKGDKQKLAVRYGPKSHDIVVDLCGDEVEALQRDDKAAA